MLSLNSVSFTLPGGKRLFENITFTLNQHEKAALIGNNGTGKSTLFRIVAGQIKAEGTVSTGQMPYYVPQLFGQFDHLSIATALRVDAKLTALNRLLNGEATERDLLILDDDWSLENRIAEAIDYWNIPNRDLTLPMGSLSGGEKTKVLLAGLMIHNPALVLLDEPTNHLDAPSRKLLYDFVERSSATMLITSHDRSLLNRLNHVFELSGKGVVAYGGNYAFYLRQSNVATDALKAEVKSMEMTLRKAKVKKRETLQRQQKLDARGRGKQEKAGLPTIMQNTLKNNSEKSTARAKEIHTDKIAGISAELKTLRDSLPDFSKMKLNIDPSQVHAGKVLFEGTGINYQYGRPLWKPPLNVKIRAGERWAIQGPNGSGKSTLLRIILGQLRPDEGIVNRVTHPALYIDQEYSMINNKSTVAQQAQSFNRLRLDEHEINVLLSRFMFPIEDWQKPCSALSGGERMRLMLCCLNISQDAPAIIILDEPTNNLDLQSTSILTAAISGYEGALIVVSHDEHFLKDIGIEHHLELSQPICRREDSGMQ